MGFFSGLNAESYDRQYSDRELVRRIVSYFKPHRKALIWVAIWLLVIAGTGAAAPILVSRGLDVMVADRGSNIMWLLAGLVFLMGLITWRMTLYAGTIRDSGQVSMSLEFPEHAIIYAVAFCFMVFSLMVVKDIVDGFSRLLKGEK